MKSCPQPRTRKKKEVQVEVSETPSIEIIDKTDRNKLSEGKDYQLGFGFLKKLADKQFKLVQPISPCKDYLNDVVWSEHTGKQCVAHGLSYTKKDIFDGVLSYMAMSILPHHAGRKYEGYEEDIVNLNENFKKTQEFINYYEEKLNLEKTVIEKVSDNLFMLTLPYFWCQYTYLISLYTLLIRCGQFYKEGEPNDFLRSYSKYGEVYNVQNTMPKLEKILNGELPKQDLANEPGGYNIHNRGIVDFKF